MEEKLLLIQIAVTMAKQVVCINGSTVLFAEYRNSKTSYKRHSFLLHIALTVFAYVLSTSEG